MPTDLSAWLETHLRTGTETELVAMRSKLALDDESICLTGDVTGEQLDVAESARRSNATPNQALFVLIQDTGNPEQAFTAVGIQRITFRIVDRLSGYHNISEVRDLLIEYLRRPFYAALDSGEVAFDLEIIERDGHRYDRSANAEFDAITVECHMLIPEDS